MKIKTKIQLEHRLKNDVRQRIKDRIKEGMEVHIKHFQNKNKTKNAKDTSNLHTIDQERHNNLQHHIFNNNTKFDKLDRYTKHTLGFATCYNPHTGLSYTCRFN